MSIQVHVADHAGMSRLSFTAQISYITGLGPMDLQEFFVPIIEQANELQQAFTLWERQRKSREHIEGQNTLRLPSVTVNTL